ncbi:hypothetical protein [Streptomyces sp. enrichment culture]|uniref:hypothetical protein n=1 Tax=Streptomyces sp. enrichment culture TaxID=1795815 RepID=UPI003F562BA6
MHSYECGNCNLRSDPFILRNSAERYGQEHRDKRHDGMHPLDEAILSGGSGVMPQPGDWKVFALVAALFVMGLMTKVF